MHRRALTVVAAVTIEGGASQPIGLQDCRQIVRPRCLRYPLQVAAPMVVAAKRDLQD
jgi:hypothetical protein